MRTAERVVMKVFASVVARASRPCVSKKNRLQTLTGETPVPL